MGSIPLPALNARPPEQPNPLEQMGQLVQLRQLLQAAPIQREIQQNQLEAGRLELQQKQQAVADQKAMTTSMQQWDGKDVEQLPSLIIKNGGSADAVFGVKQHILQQKQQLATIAKDDAETGAKNLETMKGKTDLILGALDAAKSVPDDKFVDHLDSTVQDLNQRGVLDPQHLQAAQQLIQGMRSGQTDIASGRQGLEMYEKGMMSRSAMMEQAAKEAGLKKTEAETGKAQAETSKINAEINPKNPADPNIARQKYQGILQSIQTGGIGSVSAEDLQWARAHEASEKKATTQSDTLGVTQNSVSGPAGLSAVGAGGGRRPAAPPLGGAQPIQNATPGQAQRTIAPIPNASPQSAQPQPLSNPYKPNAKDSMVDMIGNYKMNPQMLSRLLTKHPDMLGLVGTKYPDWSQAEYEARNKMVAGYTSGKQSQEINSINTAMGHVARLDEAIDALNNGNVKALNRIGNFYHIQVGDDPVTAFKTIVNRVGPEISSAYVAGGGGEAERMANKEDFNPNLSPTQLHTNAAITVQLLRSKVGALENQWKQTLGRDDFQQRFITPEAQKSFQKFSSASTPGNPAQGQFSVTAPNNKTYRFKTQQDLDNFKKSAGIQ